MGFDAATLARILQQPGYRIVGEPEIGGGGIPSNTLENVFLNNVRRIAKDNAWLAFHTHDSRRSESGFPDLTLVKPGRLVFAELKSCQGKLTHDQEVWLDVLRHSVPDVEVYCWRPSDLDDIVQILSRKGAPAP